MTNDHAGIRTKEYPKLRMEVKTNNNSKITSKSRLHKKEKSSS